jgi:hypothetical protein
MSDSLFQSEFKISQDLDLVSRAIRNRWNLDPEKLATVAQKAVELTKHPDEKIAIKACQVVAAMAAQSQKDDHKYLDLVSAASRQQTPSVTSFTQIQVGDLDSVYRLLDRMTGSEVLESPQAMDREPSEG